MFIITNTQNRETIFSVPAYANEAVLALYRTQQIFPFFLYGFAIMPDHVHLLVSVPDNGSISKILYTFKRGTAFAIDRGPIWQSRFHLLFPDDAHNVLSYIHANPVKAGIAFCQSDYPWSSAS